MQCQKRNEAEESLTFSIYNISISHETLVGFEAAERAHGESHVAETVFSASGGGCVEEFLAKQNNFVEIFSVNTSDHCYKASNFKKR